MSITQQHAPKFAPFFQQVLGQAIEPYPFQERLATEPWPAMVDVPTGLGKTAAITVAWLFKQLHRDPATPRRLLWCLPMRVLVEQTRDNVKQWLANATPFFEKTGGVVPTHHVLMGGETDDAWIRRPEDPTIVIGTQDMLLSRALMRGYGMSRYRWPIDFALVHHDALWVFDEVQLMGAGLATSAQLEAFRRERGETERPPTRSLWLSATIRPEWLKTVDFREHVDGLSVLRLSEAEKHAEGVRRRREARKTVQQLGLQLQGSRKSDVDAYAKALAHIVHEKHEDDAPTLVILNNVERAQLVAQHLEKLTIDSGMSTKLMLVHARFRQAEREQVNKQIQHLKPADDAIIVATQAVEAGVDLTSKRLFTELAPWSSLVQRFGRCNRGGEYNEDAEGGHIYWIDLDTDSNRDFALPYEVEQLDNARRILPTLTSAAPAHLPEVNEARPLTHVIRRKDFIELFNTDPDLSGHDIDISHYLRDSGQPQLHVFWRDFGHEPGEQGRPASKELCPVSLTQLQEHLKGDERAAFVWDALSDRWSPLRVAHIRPGHVVMLRASDGGYDTKHGFVPGLGAKQHPITVLGSEGDPQEAYSDDSTTHVGAFVTLLDHLLATRDEAERLCEVLDEMNGRDAVVRAALWHDVGKAHEAAQTAYRDFRDGGEADAEGLWAKTPGRGRLHYRIERNGKSESRRYFRHELASALVWLEHGPQDADHDLIAYLIAAHHGKVRLGIRALPGEFIPPDGRKFARGVWDGDAIPQVETDDTVVPATTLRLEVMEMGDGPMGPSWTARTRRLLREFGPFRMAWLEMLVRLADWRASAAIDTTTEKDGGTYVASGEVTT